MAADVAERSRFALYLDLIRWDRPAGTYLLLWPTLSALWIAAGGFPGWRLLVVFTLGTFLMRSAGCAVNDVADREFDRHVKRTASRPVTSGAIAPNEALRLGAALALIAFGLVLTTNAAAIAWSVAALAIALLYPFSKRFVSMPQAVLGIAFSFGIPMAFAAVRGDVPWLAAWLLIGNGFWVLAYDTEYAMVDRDDDLKIGIKTSAITLGRFDVAAVMAFYALYLSLIRWDRPAGSLLLLWPTLSALWLAAGGFPGWHLLVVFTLGTFLMRSAGCCINDVADREFDRHVKRTAERPVTSGAVPVREALGLGAVLALVAFALVLTTNLAAVLWSFAALALTLVYPYTKRFLSMPQAVLGIAFSFGIPMAFAAVNGGDSWSLAAVPAAVPALAWALLVGNAFWVLAYDTEYAMVDRDDDIRIGIRTSALTLGRFDVAGVMAFYALHLASWAAIGAWLGLGWPYFVAIGVGAAIALWHYTLIRARSRDGCFRAFRLNHWLGFTLFAGIALEAALRR